MANQFLTTARLKKGQGPGSKRLHTWDMELDLATVARSNQWPYRPHYKTKTKGRSNREWANRFLTTARWEKKDKGPARRGFTLETWKSIWLRWLDRISGHKTKQNGRKIKQRERKRERERETDLEFLVALRFAEQRREFVVGGRRDGAAGGRGGRRAAAAAAAAAMSRRRRCFAQFALTRFAETGQSPFASKIKKKNTPSKQTNESGLEGKKKGKWPG